MKHSLIERSRASLLHLSASFVMALLGLALVYRLWYPSPLHLAVGVNGVFLLMLAVDVVMGPLLTFVVYKKGKRTLLMDLSIIVALQLAAFAYGLWTIAEARPAWLVFNADRVDLVQAHEVDTRHRQEVKPEFRTAPWTGPEWVASVNPEDIQKRNDLVLESAMGGPDLPQRIDLYVPLASQRDALRSKALPLEQLTKFNTAEQVTAELKIWPEADAWLPLMARVQPMVVLLRRESGEPVAVVNLHPWN